MTELTIEQVQALRRELPEVDYGKILDRMKQLKADPLHKHNYEILAIQEHERAREAELVNLALRRYGSHD